MGFIVRLGSVIAHLFVYTLPAKRCLSRSMPPEEGADFPARRSIRRRMESHAATRFPAACILVPAA
jgi:hypothetical protein